MDDKHLGDSNDNIHSNGITPLVTPPETATPTPSIPPQEPLAQQSPVNPHHPETPQINTSAQQPNQSNNPFTQNNQMVSGGQDPNAKFYSNSAQITAAGGKKKKKFLIGGSVAGLLIILGLGYVVAYYIPNKPENVWSTSLDRTGDAVQKLTDEALKQENIDKVESTELSGNLEIKSDEFNFDGSMSLVYDPKKSKGDVRVSSNVNGDTEDKIQLKFLTEITNDNKYPDVFINIIGVKDYLNLLGLGNLGKYEGKWISIDNKYIESNLPAEGEDKNITSQDVSEVARIGVSTTNEYIFTNDPDKAVLVRKSIVGPEEVDGLKTYHYTVSINQDNLKKYCTEIITQIYDSESARKLLYIDNDNYEEKKQEEIKSCDDVGKNFEDGKEFDVWVDRKYKLIHKVRLYEKDNENVYTDYGQIYKGGDDITFFVRYKDNDEKTSAELNVDTNFKTFDTKGEFTYGSIGDSDNAVEAKLTFNIKPYDQEIQIDRPKDIIKLQDILKELGLPTDLGISNSSPSSESGGGGIQSKARDSERQADINAIHGQIETYFASNGFYPTLENLNDETFVGNNLPGLNREALKDPEGSDYELVGAEAIEFQYGYIVTPSGCADDSISALQCDTYTLTARLSDGSLFTKLSLN